MPDPTLSDPDWPDPAKPVPANWQLLNIVGVVDVAMPCRLFGPLSQGAVLFDDSSSSQSYEIFSRTISTHFGSSPLPLHVGDKCTIGRTARSLAMSQPI